MSLKRYLIGFTILAVSVGAAFMLLKKNQVLEIGGAANLLSVPEAAPPAGPAAKPGANSKESDIEPQGPLVNPPGEIKALYLTSWSAGSQTKVDSIIKFMKSAGLNAVVIDIKDYSGYVAYDTQIPDVIKYNAKELRIPRLNALIKKLHDQGIYVVGRVTVFQDPALAQARPDLAIQSISKSRIWTDHKGLAWIDPAAREAWDYNVSIAKDAGSRGFDEINFDYVRFASDGDLKDMEFPFYDSRTPKHLVVRNFFKYLREQTAGLRISADLFGLSTVQKDDLGIGQIIEDAYSYFDYVAPMVYPSHYASGFLGYKNPAKYPYEVIKYSMDNALSKLTAWNTEASATQTVDASGTVHTIPAKHEKSAAKLRPWIQDFNLGADYSAAMVKKEIEAVDNVFCPKETDIPLGTCRSEYLNGFMFWSPTNIYTGGVLGTN